ncbi:MAG: ligase-associated DNA damage response exonuclease [Bacteroidota bacterium]
MSLLSFTSRGIYCEKADVYIDPWRKVDKALITHGHSDHSRWGHKAYLCTHSAKPVIEHRLGKINISSVPFGETTTINGVKFSFHPAGHILGSAQIRVEYKGEIWVASGDYKLENDGLAEPFEPVRCHAFITESTFGLPVYKWKPQSDVFDAINAWWEQNKAEGKTSILAGYSLGKAQRILQNINPAIGPVLTHGAVENINEVMRAQGISLNDTIKITKETDKNLFPGSLVICPPSALGASWMKNFMKHSTAVGSGWMMLRGARRRRSVDRGFVLSDHADWDGLNSAIRETGAEKVIVTHGYTSVFSKWLRDQGLDAAEVQTRFEGELAEINDSISSSEAS